MTLRLTKKPLAEQDEERHFLNIAQDDLDAAIRWLEALESGYQHILAHPKSGANRPVTGRPDYRDVKMWVMRNPFQNWLIYFQHQPAANAVEVIRILHGAEDQQRRIRES